MMPREDFPGHKFNRLTVTGETQRRGEKTLWECRCECGGTTWVGATDIRAERPRSCGCLRREMVLRMNAAKLHTRRKEVVGYQQAHIRVSTLRGKAANHMCVDCDDPASDWSYNGLDPNELTGMVRHFVMTYSADPAYYEARCRLCHRTYDKRMKNHRKASA